MAQGRALKGDAAGGRGGRGGRGGGAGSNSRRTTSLSAAALRSHDARQRQHSEPSASGDAVAGGAKRRKTGGKALASKCISCGAAPNAASWFQTQTPEDGEPIPIGDRCMRCVAGYNRGMSMDGTFEEVCQKAADDPQYRADFDACCVDPAADGDTLPKTFFDECVDDDNEWYLETTWNYIGVSVDEFEQLVGAKPKDVNVKIQDLRNPKNEIFKGVVMVDSERPFTHYKLTHKKCVRRSIKNMRAENHCYQEQGEKTERFLRQKHEEEDIRKRLKAAPTLEELTARKKNLEEEDGDEDDEEPEKVDTLEGGGVSVRTAGPSLQSAAKAKAKSTKASPGKVGSAARCSDAASVVSKGRGSAVGRVSAAQGDDAAAVESLCDNDGAEKWEQKIQKLDLTRVLAGERMGHRSRRVREELEKVEDDDSMKVAASQLRLRLKLNNHAENLNSGKSIANMPAAELKESTDLLFEHGVEFPSNAKVNLLSRRLNDLSATLPAKDISGMVELLRALQPWPDFEIGESEGSDMKMTRAEMFDPRAATLRTCDGSVATKVALYIENMANFVFGPLLNLGTQHSEQVVKNLEWLLSVYEDMDCEIEDEYMDLVGKAMSCARCVICVLSPSAPLDHWEDLMTVVFPKEPKGPKDLCNIVGGLVKNSAHHSATVADMKACYRGMRSHFADAQALTDTMTAMATPTDAELVDALQKFQTFEEKMRAGSVTKLKSMISEKMSVRVRGILDKAAAFEQGSSGSDAHYWNTAFDFLASVLGVESSLQDPSWVSAHSKCKAIIPKMQDSELAAAYITELKGLKKESFTESAVLDNLVDKAGKVKSGVGIMDKESFEKLLGDCFGLAVDFMKSEDGLTHDILGQLSKVLGMWVLQISASTDQKEFCKMLGFYENLHGIAGKFEKLTVPFGEHVQNPKGMQDLRTLLSYDKGYNESAKDPQHNFGNKFIAKYVGDIRTKYIEVARKEMKSALDTAAEGFMNKAGLVKQAGGTDNGSSWKDKLADSAKISDVLSHAEKTLLKVKAVPFKECLDQAEAHRDQYLETYGLFDDDPMASPTYVTLAAAVELGRATQYEGVICHNLRAIPSEELGKLKKAMAEPKKAIIEKYKIQGKVHPALFDAVEKASRLRRVL